MKTLTVALAALVILAVLVSTACTSFDAVPVEDARRELAPGDGIRVTLVDGRVQRHEVDSVVPDGIVVAERTLPFEEIAVLERAHFDLLKSFGLYLAIGVVMLALELQDGSLY